MRRYPSGLRFRPRLEALESRALPSTTVSATYRPLEFSYEGSFSGSVMFPPPNEETPGAMIDWSGTLAGKGKVSYTSPIKGTGTVSGTGAGSGTGSTATSDITYEYKLTASASFAINEADVRVSRTGFGMTITEREGSGPTDGTPFPPSPSTDAFFDALSGLSVNWDFPIGMDGGRTGSFMMDTFEQLAAADTDLRADSVVIKNGVMTGVVSITGKLMDGGADPESATNIRFAWATGATPGTIIGDALADDVAVAWNHGKLTITSTDVSARPNSATHLLMIADDAGGVNENDENNNVAAFAITPAMAAKGTLTNTAPVNERGVALVKFSGPSSPAGVDAGGTYHYAYDWNNDGTWDAGDGTWNGSLSGASQTIPPQFLDDGPGSRTLKGRIIGKFGGFNDYTTTIALKNVAPTATFAGPVREGTPSSVTFNSPTDVSTADAAAGPRYAYDFNNDGTWEIGDGTYAGGTASASENVPAEILMEGNAKKFIKGRIIDKDGGFTDYLANVENVGPTATLTNNGPINEGGSATVTFSNPADPSAGDTTAGFRYSYDLNNDGRWDVGNGTFTGGSKKTSHSFTIPDNGPRIVKARIIDRDGGFTDYTTTIDVNSIAPTAIFRNNVNGQVKENGAATVSFASQADPSTVDRSKGFRYSYDFDGDGIWEVGNGTHAGGVTSASKAIPPSFLADGPRTLSVKGRIIDKDGQFTDYTTTINVLNVAPTAALKSNGPKAVGENMTFTFLSATDLSLPDRLAGFTFGFDWNNDGVMDETGAASVVQHAFATAGSRTVRGRVIDKDGGFRDYFVIVLVR